MQVACLVPKCSGDTFELPPGVRGVSADTRGVGSGCRVPPPRRQRMSRCLPGPVLLCLPLRAGCFPSLSPVWAGGSCFGRGALKSGTGPLCLSVVQNFGFFLSYLSGNLYSSGKLFPLGFGSCWHVCFWTLFRNVTESLSQVCPLAPVPHSSPKSELRITVSLTFTKKQQSCSLCFPRCVCSVLRGCSWLFHPHGFPLLLRGPGTPAGSTRTAGGCGFPCGFLPLSHSRLLLGAGALLSSLTVCDGSVWPVWFLVCGKCAQRQGDTGQTEVATWDVHAPADV